MTLKLASANILKDYRQARKRKEEKLKKRKHSGSVPGCPESMDKKEETLKKCTRMSGKHGQKEEKSGCMESIAGGIVKAENEMGA